MDVLMARTADDDGLAAPFGHEVYPGRPVGPVMAVEVGELADVVDFDLVPRVADLTAVGEEPVDQLVSLGAGHDRCQVDQDRVALAFERDPAEAGDQWFPTMIACDGDLETGPLPSRGVDDRLVLSGHLGDRGAVFTS